MELSPNTKIDELLTAYPFLVDYLITVSPHFKNLKNPIMRKTMGKVATLKLAANMAGVDLDRLISGIAAEIKARTGEEAGPAGTGPALDPAARQEALKAIIRDLHADVDMEVLKKRFKEIIHGVDAPEIARLEQQLIAEGLPVEEVKRLCDVHVELFKEALEEHDLPQPPPGHPVHTFMKENRASEQIMSAVSLVLGRLGTPPSDEAFAEHKDELGGLIDRLAEINVHYLRKENQLFPLLEAHHFTGPSQVMWAIHDEIRANLKAAREAFERSQPEQTAAALKEAIKAIREMIYKEEHILYPTSLDMLSEAEWIEVKEGEPEIGYAWVEPDSGWPEKVEAAPQPAVEEPAPAEALRDVADVLGLDTGRLTLEQINLMLTHLPVDLTFVDENDRVAYYSDGPERIFPRSPAVIGREVRNCHPPKSVHLVNQILDSFKSKDRDTAEFWIELGGRFIYIRYFAVRDAEGNYKGCLEVSQDLTEIRKLEGEKRLLD